MSAEVRNLPLVWLQYICCYSEPVEVIEPTVIAALNMSYPGECQLRVFGSSVHFLSAQMAFVAVKSAGCQ